MLLISVEKIAGPEIRIDVAQPVHEHIRTDKIVNLADVFHYPVMNIEQEVVAVSLEQEGFRHVFRFGLILLEHILEI